MQVDVPLHSLRIPFKSGGLPHRWPRWSIYGHEKGITTSDGEISNIHLLIRYGVGRVVADRNSGTQIIDKVAIDGELQQEIRGRRVTPREENTGLRGKTMQARMQQNVIIRYSCILMIAPPLNTMLFSLATVNENPIFGRTAFL